MLISLRPPTHPRAATSHRATVVRNIAGASCFAVNNLGTVIFTTPDGVVWRGDGATLTRIVESDSTGQLVLVACPGLNDANEVQVYILMSAVTADRVDQLTAAGVTIEIEDAARRRVQARVPASRLRVSGRRSETSIHGSGALPALRGRGAPSGPPALLEFRPMAFCNTLCSRGLTRALILFRIGPNPSFSAKLPAFLARPRR